MVRFALPNHNFLLNFFFSPVTWVASLSSGGVHCSCSGLVNWGSYWGSWFHYISFFILFIVFVFIRIGSDVGWFFNWSSFWGGFGGGFGCGNYDWCGFGSLKFIFVGWYEKVWLEPIVKAKSFILAALPLGGILNYRRP